MPTQTPTAEEFFNLLMGMINPELCLGIDCDAIRPGETQEQYKERLAGYDRDFATFDAVLKDCDHSVTIFSRLAQESAEHQEELNTIEKNFDDTDA